MGRRKQIALTVPIPHPGIHVNVSIKIVEKASHEKNLNLVQHALRNPFVKGKRSSCITININREAYMKITIVTLVCCAVLAPLAFAQTGSKGTTQGATTTERITVTGTIIKMTTEEGAAANYQPFKTLVVREDRSNTPGSYVLKGPGHVVNKNGEVIRTAIKPGTHVRIYYANTGDLRMVDHVVVD
jgi:hypothetical protein